MQNARGRGKPGCRMHEEIGNGNVVYLTNGWKAAIFRWMADEQNLKNPWLVAAWPGMGGVGISAAYYLMAKLGMHLLVEFPAREFFELDNVEVKEGLIRTGKLPRSRLFLWKDPKEEHDLIVFIGEAQPPSKGDAFCAQLITRAKNMGVERVFTFAAMATRMQPGEESRVFGAAIDPATLEEFQSLDLQVLEEGTISGLNGVLLGVAAQNGLKGGCLLGEMPHVFPQFPFPKGSLSVLAAFSAMAGCSIDLDELEDQAHDVEEKLSEILDRVGKSSEQTAEAEPFETMKEEEDDQRRLSERDEQRIEELFEQARRDRSRAYELKQELDRLKVFSNYEDRFLDLFQEPQ